MLSSLAVHLLLLLGMMLIVLPLPHPDLSSFFTISNEVETNPEVLEVEDLEILPQRDHEIRGMPPALLSTEVLPKSSPPILFDRQQEELQLNLEAAEFLSVIAKKGDLAGRTEQGRAILARAFGGNTASEQAVAAGLEWLKRHQRKDGSWSFDHRGPDCDDSCSDGGAYRSATVAATAMALLCYVGGGHTHEEGHYQSQVQQGLEFLKTVSTNSKTPGDLRQGDGSSGMYSQGLVTIFLCELYGLTKDKMVKQGAQSCLDFIIEAQHPKSGGWRYHPGEEQGDTSVVGWQVMALTSGRMARLNVPMRPLIRADHFLDTVMLEDGAYYGYMRGEKKPSTTAIGLLCRMYRGWGVDQPALKVGVNFLSKIGPSHDNMYYNYYATQVLHHWGGDEWKRWNSSMRDWLIETQHHGGHSDGSWPPLDPHARQGGRLYVTCLAILTLEVYYRHLPLYQNHSVQSQH